MINHRIRWSMLLLPWLRTHFKFEQVFNYSFSSLVHVNERVIFGSIVWVNVKSQCIFISAISIWIQLFEQAESLPRCLNTKN